MTLPAATIELGGGPTADTSAEEPAPRPRPSVRTRLAVGAISFLVLLALAALSISLRTRAIDTSYWIDEGIATGIARYPLHEIPSKLLLDGSPPLYYLLLHCWELMFGTGELGTRSLSLLFSTLTIPVSYLFALRIAGRRAAWVAALLAAGHPFLTYYAQETRMYSLVALEALIFSGFLVLVFTRRERRFVPLAALSGASLLYTHNWGIFSVAASFVACLVVVFTADKALRRSSIIDGVLIYGGIGLLWLPWVPSFIAQAGSTGAPWSLRPGIGDLFSAMVVPFGYRATGVVLAIIVLVAAIGVATRARVGDKPTTRAALLLVVMVIGSGAFAWAASQVSPAWSLRYLAVSVGPVLLLSGLVLARVPTVGAAVLCLLVLTWAQPLEASIRAKSNTAQVAALAVDYGATQPGDVVISPHPEQLPVISHYMGPNPRYATSLGFQADTRIFDWRHALDRLGAAHPSAVWKSMEPTITSGADIVLAVPILRSASWRAPWTSLVKRRSIQWELMLAKDPSLRRLGELPRFGDRGLPRGIRLIVYRKR